jgi:hypothetical protein
MGGQLIGDETPAPLTASEVELHIIQAKFEDSFKETAVEKLESFARDLLDYSKPVTALTYLNSKVRDSIRNFRTKYDAILGRPHALVVLFHYACVASEIPSVENKVMTRAANLTAYVKSVLGMANVEFVPWSASTLHHSVRSNPATTVVIPASHNFSTEDESTVCLVKLTDFARRLLSTDDGKLQTRFLEPNVRDYQGKNNPVNRNIHATLESQELGDFWWLNNGITVLATHCSSSGNKITIRDPEIVNGLQTSHEVFNWYIQHTEGDDKRSILLRIIVSPDDELRTKIIKATNSQTKVSELSLLSTEPIQQIIEDRLRLHGLFYDRKKGRCRRLRRDYRKVVGMRAISQAVIAVALRKPDEARGRPETYVNSNPEEVFDPNLDGDAYVACVLLDRQIDEYLESSELSTDMRRNIRHYMGMCITSELLDDGYPLPHEIGENLTLFKAVPGESIERAKSLVLEVYKNLGGTDDTAKNKTMRESVQGSIEKNLVGSK